ncbi:hypothetical protein FOL47_004667 [Perkinsus chesapeaki]|uniref:Uncharacterized protein n=1 Tax=Perkinsus chesapeaki TaxID=330153 RepID=A0A7J6M1D7_PERCH|nr:hypothetical protein FOL47_004667 [Perkinsus chesapeaki]
MATKSITPTVLNLVAHQTPSASLAASVAPSSMRHFSTSDDTTTKPKPWGDKGNEWVLADVCIVPLGVGTSVSKYVSEVEKVLRNYPGVSTTLHGYGTNIEGQWSDVMEAVKAAHEVLHEMGCPRVNSNMRFGTRIDKHQTLQDKVDKVETILASQDSSSSNVAANLPRTRAASFNGINTPADYVNKCINKSLLISSLKANPTNATYSRPVSTEEIRALEEAGCIAEDWANVYIGSQGPLPVKGMIRDSTFQGRVEISVKEGSTVVVDGRSLPCGIRNTVLEDAVIEEGTLVQDCGIVAHTTVRRGAALLRCGVIQGGSLDCTYGNGHTLPLAEETGSRDTKQFAELTIEVAAKVASDRSTAADYHKALGAYVRAVQAAGQGRSVIDEGATVISCPSVKGSYIGRNVTAVNSKIENSCLLHGNTVEDCSLNTAILQKGAGVESFGVVEGATLCPTVHVERHGKVFDSIVGPCTSIAEGEVTASLVGPFVGFHHQALLIACFWPSGRGNIGYGANVGSNHTGKAPDQENWPGEGTFFGLATNIKYPCNLVDSPYSLIATGVSCLPQAIGLPFSLVNESTECIAGLSPAINEVTPGWMLSDNMYSLYRNEAKFESRQGNLPKDGVMYQYAVFRPDIMDRVVNARDALKAADPKTTTLRDSKGQPVFTDKQISIIGKNWMHESARVKAITTYTTFLKWYAIRGLWRRLSEGGRKEETATAKIVSNTLAYLKSPPAIDLTPLYQNLTACAYRDDESQGELRELQWAHECKILRSECQDPLNVSGLLRWYADTNLAIANSCVKAKSRDDSRGARIIGKSYTEAHESASENKVCQKAIGDAKQVKEDIEAFLATSKL